MSDKGWFDHIAKKASDLAGSAGASALALTVIVAWGFTGPLFGFSETWQLVINTGTTIITFLMVFLLQHAQNSDTKALHAKIDELIRAIPGARNEMAGVEERDAEVLEELVEEVKHVEEEVKHVEKEVKHE